MSGEWMIDILNKADKQAEVEEGPKWMLLTCFRAETEDEAKQFRDHMQVFVKHEARHYGRRLEDLLLFRFEGDSGEIIE